MEIWPDTEVKDYPVPPPKKRKLSKLTSNNNVVKDFNNVYKQMVVTPEEILIGMIAASKPMGNCLNFLFLLHVFNFLNRLSARALKHE